MSGLEGGEVAIAWFRRDLRVSDHPALSAAVDSRHQVVPLFVLDERHSASHARRALMVRAALGGGSEAALGDQAAACYCASGSVTWFPSGPREPLVGWRRAT
jgi:hypothetical protein